MIALGLQAWMPTIISLLTLICVFSGRTWLRKRIEQNVQHTFDNKLEKIRSALRVSEEKLKDELRTNESELSTLRENLLSGRAQRQALLDKRCFDAIDRIWGAMMDMAPYKAIAGMMERINLEYVAKEAPRDEKVRKFIASLTDNTFKIPSDNIAKNERPFVTSGVLAYYLAYQTVLLTIFAQAKILEFGVECSDKMIKVDVFRDMLKKALPHHSDLIEKNSIFVFSIFIDELEECVLAEIKKMLDGQDLDQANLIRMAGIIQDSNKISAPVTVM